VGPASAGAVPGPACYGRGGLLPTVTDAALILGYLDPDFFLGGTIALDVAAARAVLHDQVAVPLGLSDEAAAAAVIEVVTENMVQAISDITVNQGIDPAQAVLVGGGGGAGINSVLIARRLGSRRLLVPEVGAALSAAGALMADVTAQMHTTVPTRTTAFDFAGVNAVLDALRDRGRRFIAEQGHGSVAQSIRLSAEARYPQQVWEIAITLPVERFATDADVEALRQAFHAAHREIFAIDDPASPVEIVSWNATIACRLRDRPTGVLAPTAVRGGIRDSRPAYFPGHGFVSTRVHRFEAIAPGEPIAGPAIIESAVTAVVIHPGVTAERRASGSLSIDPGQ
jgi:N-methylhydantoinase A